MTTSVIRVMLPYHLQNLAHVGPEISLEVEGPITQSSVLDAIERRYPMLCGTIRDHVTKKRRPFLRYFGCEKDMSHDPPDTPLPAAISSGTEPFIIWGAMAGG
ncbi:MAG: MoaD/ThiS family protein [Planctomycetaceae bacterium]